MKKSLQLTLMLAVVALSGLFTSCYNDWGAPQRPVNFYDSRLYGYWQLVQINGYAVSGNDTNYLYFNGSGNGVYYYFQNSRRYKEGLQYWCQDGYYDSDYEINILYQSSYNPSTMNYWFSNGGNALYIQWYDYSSRHTVTYLYTRYPSAPW